MIDNLDPSLRAELLAAMSTLEPQVRGLADFAEISSSGKAEQTIVNELVVRQRRLGYIEAVLEAIDDVEEALHALYADGYPNFAPVVGTQPVMQEINGEDADLQAAANIFRSGPAAIGLDLSNIIHGHQAIPTS